MLFLYKINSVQICPKSPQLSNICPMPPRYKYLMGAIIGHIEHYSNQWFYMILFCIKAKSNENLQYIAAIGSYKRLIKYIILFQAVSTFAPYNKKGGKSGHFIFFNLYQLSYFFKSYNLFYLFLIKCSGIFIVLLFICLKLMILLMLNLLKLFKGEKKIW